VRPEDEQGLARARAADLSRAFTLANLTDRRFLDPLVGLVLPGVGDALGALLGLYIVALARKHDAPASLQARMLVNLAVDCLGGLVPVAGDLFDLLNRANLRNARLLEKHLAPVPEVRSGKASFVSRKLGLPLAALLLTIALGATGVVVVLGVRHFWR